MYQYCIKYNLTEWMQSDSRNSNFYWANDEQYLMRIGHVMDANQSV